MTDRKSGIRRKRGREARRLVRDRKIYRFMRSRVAVSQNRHRMLHEEIEPLSVYVGKVGVDRRITPFPMKSQLNGKPLPAWKDLSAWMKVQLLAAALNQWEFQTFNIIVHPKLESAWVSEGKDPRAKMRDRVRDELDKAFGTGREFFFVLEGWSKLRKAPTKLHIHGGAAIYDPGDAAKIENAVSRAAGHGLKGYAKVNRAINTKPFTRERAGYATYLFKYAKRLDDRMADRRLTMSRSSTGAAKELWDTVSGRKRF